MIAVVVQPNLAAIHVADLPVVPVVSHKIAANQSNPVAHRLQQLHAVIPDAAIAVIHVADKSECVELHSVAAAAVATLSVAATKLLGLGVGK